MTNTNPFPAYATGKVISIRFLEFQGLKLFNLKVNKSYSLSSRGPPIKADELLFYLLNRSTISLVHNYTTFQTDPRPREHSFEFWEAICEFIFPSII